MRRLLVVVCRATHTHTLMIGVSLRGLSGAELGRVPTHCPTDSAGRRRRPRVTELQMRPSGVVSRDCYR